MMAFSEEEAMKQMRRLEMDSYRYVDHVQLFGTLDFTTFEEFDIL